MVALALVLSLLVLRKGGSTPQRPESIDQGHPVLHVLRTFSPLEVLRIMRYPNVLLTVRNPETVTFETKLTKTWQDIACGLLSWSQYALLSSPRHILVTQFNLTSPLISGLFYLSPAAGFLLGTLVGGRFSDHTVRQWIKRRDGLRLPQDRLRSGFASWFLVIPAASLIFGWGIEKHVGGLALPIVTAFFSAAGILAAFAGLNTNCAGTLGKILGREVPLLTIPQR